MQRTILIVDDNEAVRRAIRHVLEKNPHWRVCGEAVNGREGIEKEKELQPDLVIVDLSMPVMNGLEVARALKRNRPTLHVVLFTMFKDKRLEEEAFASGISLVISKADGISALADFTDMLLRVTPGGTGQAAVSPSSAS